MIARLLQKLSSYITLANVRKLIEAVGGRRFTLTLGAGAVTSILVWYAKITPEIYRDIILGTVGIYIAGNTFQKSQEIKANPPKE